MSGGRQYSVFETALGWVGVLGSEVGLLRTTLPHPFSRQALEDLGELIWARESAEFFSDLRERLRAYFSGQEVNFPDKLDLSAATLFQRHVWGTARRIPFGETRSYGWVAAQIQQSRAARAVGQALGKNPFLIIVPCHRVLAGDGKLGGFGGGLDMKRRLLKLEGWR